MSKEPLNNTVLASMLAAGAGAIVLGVILWTVNFDTDTYDGGAQGRTIGLSLALFGAMLTTLGWAVAAICRQIVDAASGRTGNKPS